MNNNRLVGRGVMSANETQEMMEEFTYGQTISASPSHEKEIKIIGMRWKGCGIVL